MTWQWSKDIYSSSGLFFSFLRLWVTLEVSVWSSTGEDEGKSMIVSTSSSSLVLKQLFKALSFEATLEYSLHVSRVLLVTPTNHKNLDSSDNDRFFFSCETLVYLSALKAFGLVSPFEQWFWDATSPLLDSMLLRGLLLTGFSRSYLADSASACWSCFSVLQWAMLDLLIFWHVWCAWFCFLFS